MTSKIFTKALIAFLYLFSLLPYPILYFFSSVFSFFIYHVFHYRRDVVRENLTNSFPEKSLEEIKSIEKRFYHYLGDLIVESIKMISVSQAEASKRFVLLNADLLRTYFSQHKSVIAVSGHYANWEMISLMGPLYSEPKLAIYKPLSNKVFDEFMTKIRSRFGTSIIPMGNVMRKLVEFRKQRIITLLISDQTPSQRDAHYYTKFLNQNTAIFLGVEKLAKATGSAVVFCDIQVKKRGFYTCSFIPLIENPETTAEFEITEAHVSYLELMIRRAPQYWLWSHRRWKFKQVKE